jgi:glycosidase
MPVVNSFIIKVVFLFLSLVNYQLGANHLKNRLLLFYLLIISTHLLFAQNFTIDKIEPPSWWTGMEWDTLQLMVYGENLSGLNIESEDDRIKILNIHKPENPSYLFVDIFIPGEIDGNQSVILFSNKEKQVRISYPIHSKTSKINEHRGFSNEDVIYLIFADRFCDGNPLNNTLGDSLDQFTSSDLDGRKGGDIEGILSKLDYLNELGVTSIWITPLLENNMWMSYHGYAATDLYSIDPRLGNNDSYKLLVEEAHERGISVILDHVSNHIGINHPWINNPPSEDWFNGSPGNFLNASHDKIAFLDFYGDTTVVKYHQRGWFTDYMPDLNQRNAFLKKYLIQNTLWWIEYAGIDGIREDTYPYNDQKYLADWADAVLSEYPDFNIVGEVWKGIPAIISGYQRNSPVRKTDFDSNLPALTDFAFTDAVRAYLNGEEGIGLFYETLAQDIVYSDPDNLLVFLDNHDIERAMYAADGNIDKFKVALNLLLFTRGIPVIFYGTEIGIKGGLKHGELRQPFPGGFPADERNAFVPEGRTESENDIYNYLHELLNLRNEYPVLKKGKMRHIYPGGDIYIIIKKYLEDTAVIIVNAGDKKFPLNPMQINTFLPQAMTLRNLKTDEKWELSTGKILSMDRTSAEIFLVEN